MRRVFLGRAAPPDARAPVATVHDMLQKLKLIVGLLLLFLVVIFTLQNADVVTIRFLGWELTLSLALLIFIVLVVGVLAGGLLGSLSRRRGHARQAGAPSPRPTPPGRSDLPARD